MPKPRNYIPKLSRHIHGQAFVKIGGQQIWLGRYGEPLTQEKYDRYVAVWLANGRSMPRPPEAPQSQEPSVLDLLADYWRWAKERYTPAEATTIRSALRIVERLYGSEAAVRFGPTATVTDTLVMATANLAALKDDARVADKVGEDWMSEAVLDKGYHSKQGLLDLEEMDLRSYASEPDRGPQKWKGQLDAREAVYANRRRVKGERGKRLLRSRGEKPERSFAHCYETGAMRHLYLRGRENIAKPVLIHVAGFNIGLMMRLK